MVENSPNALTRADLAKQANIGIETVRFYEKKGLLLPDFRDSSNYRRYGARAVRRARAIRSAKDLGFSLEEISQLFEIFDSQENPCPSARSQAMAKIELIDRKIGELSRMKRELASLAQACERSEPTGRCAIRHRLENRIPPPP